MADKYLKSSATPLNWNDAASWESSPGQGDNAGVPQAGDTVYIMDGSADLIVDAPTQALGYFSVHTDYQGTIMVDNQIDVDGDADFGGATYEGSADISVTGAVAGTLSAANWSNYTGTLVHDGTSGTPSIGDPDLSYLPDFEVNPGGAGCTPTAQVDLSLGSFTGTTGAFDDNGKTIALRGDLKYGNPGTFDMTSTGTWDMQETADLDGSDYVTNTLAHLKVSPAGKTTTCTGSTSAKELTLGSGTFNGGGSFRFYPDADDKWHQDEDNNLDGPVVYFYGPTAIGPVYSAGSHILVYKSSHEAEVVSALGTWRLTPGAAPLTIYNYQTDGLMTLEMGEHSLVAGDITIGGSSGRGPGKLDLGTGDHRIAGTVAKHATGDASGNEVALGACSLSLSGTLDGGGTPAVTVTSRSAHVTGGGTIKNCNVTGGYLYAWGAKDGGGNSGRIVWKPMPSSTLTNAPATAAGGM